MFRRKSPSSAWMLGILLFASTSSTSFLLAQPVRQEGEDTSGRNRAIPQFVFGPIPGVTTAWHPVPEEAAIPIGTRIDLLMRAPRGASVAWEWATETLRDPEGSWAECHLEYEGTHRIGVRASFRGGDTRSFSCVVHVVRDRPGTIGVGAVQVRTTPNLDPSFGNRELVDAWFDRDSLAQLTEVGPSTFATSVAKRVSMSIDLDPELDRFGPLLEWRVNGHAVHLGRRWSRDFTNPGLRSIAVGPPSMSREVRLWVYRVFLEPEDPTRPSFREGEPLTFRARTDPPGFEDHVTWIGATKYGTARPRFGRGSSFTVVFDDVVGPFQRAWLGVRGDDARLGQDSKGESCPGSSILDQSGGACLEASRNPACGRLFPLSSDFMITSSGRVAIGGKNPTRTLDVRGASAPAIGVTDGSSSIEVGVATQGHFFSNLATQNDLVLRTGANASGDLILSTRNANGSAIRFATGTTVTEAERVRIEESGRVGIGVTTPRSELEINGTMRTSVLRLVGGADLSELFSVLGSKRVPGAVVCIDRDNPGFLRESQGEYDRSVVGVISGAGGVRPGLVLSQEDVLGGETLVSLVGRVYCLCDASSEPIVPGDLLTTSAVPGHAMKATDPARKFGAVLGRAMTGLEEDRGLVLVDLAFD